MIKAPDIRAVLYQSEQYRENPTYERRIVAFYDVLGWKNKIREAGVDQNKIGDLRRVILQYTTLVRLRKETFTPDLRFSSFSDNMVISAAVADGPVILLGLAIIQLTALFDGFLIRGGVTVGDIFHDEAMIFGPALNRAYEIKKYVAAVPRIVVDGNCLSEIRRPAFVVEEDGVAFLDPFTHKFLMFMQWFNKQLPKDDIGLAMGRADTTTIMRAMLETLKVELKKPLKDKEWNKGAWLFDRIATQLGVPLAKFYPRTRMGIEPST